MGKAITFIINPASGYGATRKRLTSLMKEIRSQAKNARIELTHHPLHAIGLTKAALRKGCERIAVVGGDGTLNEVVNGYFDRDGKPLNEDASVAVVPSGTGSDFYRNISTVADFKLAIERAVSGEAFPTDVGYIEAHDANSQKVSRHFINVASLGLSGLVAGFMKTVTKRFGGKAAYFFATIQAIRAYSLPDLLFQHDGHNLTLKKCSLISFANGKFFGSGMKIAPNALLDDGLLDLIAILNLGPLFFLINSHRVYQGTHLALDNVHEYRIKKSLIVSLSPGPVYIETDGELFAQLPATFSIKPKAIKMAR